MTISVRLNALIRERGIPKKDVAAEIGVAPSTFQTWIGRGEDFPAQFVMPLCNVLHISPEKLLLGIDKPLPEIPKDYVQLTNDELFLVETIRSLDREGVVVVTNKAIEEARRMRAAQGNSPLDNRLG